MHMREAVRDDLHRIIELIAEDQLGATRERLDDPLPHPYVAAFEAIEADPNQLLMVLEKEGVVEGTCQVTFIPGLSRLGSWRAQVEAVRVARSMRGKGAGASMMKWVIERARDRGCALVQLTTDKSRDDAHRFYERLGFVASHEGMKLRF